MTDNYYNRIINADCDIILKELIDKNIKVDLILTDPPYNIGKDFGNESDKLDLDVFLSITHERLLNCKTLLSDKGSIVWFSSHKYVGFISTYMYKIGLHYRRMNIWHYQNGMSRQTREPITEYEPFLWFSKSDSEWTYNLDDVRVPYKSERIKNPVYKKNKNGEKVAWTPNPKGAKRGDIWKYPILSGKLFANEKTGHPTQKPESLITDIIKAFTPKNSEGFYEGTILDPFIGSGTTAVCCEKLNKQGHKIKWIGIELNEDYCKIATERLRNVQMLF